MSDAYLGEIRLLGFNWAPLGWLTCDGQTLAISQYNALFALIGTMYGGDGINTFGLPDLRGRTLLHRGTAGHPQTEAGGSENVTLQTAGMPPHSHALKAISAASADTTLPQGNSLAKTAASLNLYADAANLVAMNNASLLNPGTPAGHNNMQPTLVMNYCICVEGLWPPRS